MGRDSIGRFGLSSPRAALLQTNQRVAILASYACALSLFHPRINILCIFYIPLRVHTYTQQNSLGKHSPALGKVKRVSTNCDFPFRKKSSQRRLSPVSLGKRFRYLPDLMDKNIYKAGECFTKITVYRNKIIIK